MAVEFENGVITEARFVFVYNKYDKLRTLQFHLEEKLKARYDSESVQNRSFHKDDPKAVYFALKHSKFNKSAVFGKTTTNIIYDFSGQDMGLERCLELILKDASAVKKALKDLAKKIEYDFSGIILHIEFNTKELDGNIIAEHIADELIKENVKDGIITCNVKLGYDLKDGIFRNYDLSVLNKVTFKIENDGEPHKFLEVDDETEQAAKKALGLKLDINDRGSQKHGKKSKEPEELIQIMREDIQTRLKQLLPKLPNIKE